MKKHPAKFPARILEAAHTHLLELGVKPPARIVDPMAGIGTGVKYFADRGYVARGLELEQEWARETPGVHCGDATDPWPLPWSDRRTVDAVVTSPAYGNRMADKYAGDVKGSTRHTYRISLGRPLSDGSGASLQWGQNYRDLHTKFIERTKEYVERVLIVNVKNHVRGGTVMPVVEWWASEIQSLFDGWKVELDRIPATGVRHGANGELRVDHEVLIIATAPGVTRNA